MEREGKKDRKSNIFSQDVSTIEITSEETLSFTEFTFSFLYDGQTMSNRGEKNHLWGQMLLGLLHPLFKYWKPEMFHGLVFLFFRFKDICIYIIIYLK